DLAAVDRIAIGPRQTWSRRMPQVAAAFVEQQDRREKLRLRRSFDRCQVPRENGRQVGPGGKFALQLALPLVQRFPELKRECHPESYKASRSDWFQQAIVIGISFNEFLMSRLFFGRVQ